MINAYFERQEGDEHAARWLAEEATVGPWSPVLQHGGPPNALAVTIADQLVRASTGRDDLVPVRLAADFVGAVPVGEITSRARLLRTARSAALAEVVLGSAGRDALLVRVWFVRRADTVALTAADSTAVPPLPEPSTSSWDFGYGRSIDWRYVHGAPDERGPAAVWTRARLPLIAGDDLPLTGLARAVLVADSASGVSAELDWTRWSFVNVDLDVHLSRPLEGEWVLLEASTTLGPAGSALARSTIADPGGVCGTGLQTLVVAEIPSAGIPSG